MQVPRHAVELEKLFQSTMVFRVSCVGKRGAKYDF